MSSHIIPELVGLIVTALVIFYFVGCAFKSSMMTDLLGNYSKLKWFLIVPVFIGLSSTLINGLAIVLPLGSSFGDSNIRDNAAILLGALGAILLMILAYAHALLQTAEDDRCRNR